MSVTGYNEQTGSQLAEWRLNPFPLIYPGENYPRTKLGFAIDQGSRHSPTKHLLPALAILIVTFVFIFKYSNSQKRKKWQHSLKPLMKQTLGVGLLPSSVHGGHWWNTAQLIHTSSLFCHQRMLILVNCFLFVLQYVFWFENHDRITLIHKISTASASAALDANRPEVSPPAVLFRGHKMIRVCVLHSEPLLSALC